MSKRRETLASARPMSKVADVYLTLSAGMLI
jgi:hypothetical protein